MGHKDQFSVSTGEKQPVNQLWVHDSQSFTEDESIIMCVHGRALDAQRNNSTSAIAAHVCQS